VVARKLDQNNFAFQLSSIMIIIAIIIIIIILQLYRKQQQSLGNHSQNSEA
jgi:hypothetical protein